MPLARVLVEQAPLLGLGIADILELSLPRDPERPCFLFALLRFRELVGKVNDEGFQRALGEKLGARFAKDHEGVPWYRLPFELLPGRVRALVEQRSSVARPNPPPAPPKGPVKLEFRDGKRPTLRIRAERGIRGEPLECEINGPTRAPLARMVMEQPEQRHTWRGLLEAGLHSGHWCTRPASREEVRARIASPDTLRRQGGRIRAALPKELQGYWEQDGKGVRWTLS